jgi:diacylglycerol kinase (ATP)
VTSAKIIVNPYAGRWKAKAAIPEIRRTWDALRAEYDLVVTEGPGHGIDLAREAARAGFNPVVAAGGDGSISEVLNGLLQAAGKQEPVSMGVIPLGSADDFADMVGLAKGVESASRAILAGRTRALDVGCVNGRYFDNNSAVGLEPMVTLTQAAMKRLKGTPRYILAAFKTILSHEPWHMQLTWDDGSYEGPITLVSVGNTKRTGGAFWMTPRAEPDDGYLDFVFGGEMGRLKLVRLLPTTFNGSHVDRPEVTYERTTRLTIDSERPTPIQADGEVFDLAATHIEYSLLPGRLHVIVPAGEPAPPDAQKETRTIMRAITIHAGDVSLTAELNDSATADLIWDALPIDGPAQTWGDEIYFEIPVVTSQASDARQDVEVGTLAYWPVGHALCIFFGPTPVSTGDLPRAYSPVNVVGKVVGDAALLRKVSGGVTVRLTRAEG